ncbi:MAG: TAT-variant-translocated molybdopterin oxidoreductase [Pirellulales bacterium]|nr:TAT-variant-translocated molybdopterin oxidoreductase [Pirellulales bacterium]
MSSLGGQYDTWWRSLNELADAPGFRTFLKAEFPAEAEASGMSRRRMLQLMGASLTLAAAGGCRWKKQEILPFAERPEGRMPGKFEKFATAIPLGNVVHGLEVTCVDGRPIKIDGNPQHPESRGASTVFAQAALLELYDPDRSQCVVRRDGDKFEEQTWEKFEAECDKLFRRLHESGGKDFCALAEADSSPTLDALRSKLLKVFRKASGDWYVFEPLSDDNEETISTSAKYQWLRTHWRLDRANVIVCLDADPLGSHPAAVRYARDFTAGRDPESGRMNRLYVVESGVSLTGASADHRLPLRASKIPDFTVSLEQSLKSPGKIDHPFLRAMVADLLKPENHGRSIVCAGPAQPPDVHGAVQRINALLGNVGEEKTVTYTSCPHWNSHIGNLRFLTELMKAGKVGCLLILGGNPVYNAPADLMFGKALEQVETSIHLSLYRNETSRCCTWHLPRAHFLESWGDGRAYDGTYSVIQPMIAPLRNGRSAIEVLSRILESADKSGGEIPKPEGLVQQTFHELFGRDSQAAWQCTIRDGLLAGSHWPIQTLQSLAEVPHPKPLSKGERTLEVIFRGSRTIDDGRFANNGWLQELPDPVTKLTWGNAALIGPSTAKKLKLENGDLAILKLDGRELQTPVYIQPGLAEETIELTLGYGRRAAGNVGGEIPEVEPVGVDVYPLRTTKSMYLAAGATLVPTGKKAQLAGTQDHYAIDVLGQKTVAHRAGELIRQATLEHYQKEPQFAQDEEHPPLKSLWNALKYDGHRWGMAIDLSKCIGCEACVTACQAENNIPLVGKEQVIRGREMHWLRVDRYFQGDPENPRLAFQPLPCQQCELAPCEQVCPVAATTHSHEGLNDMVYNRCVGTRYCANNCPYKVRRFNFFNYHKEFENPADEIGKMKYNPQVTVRSRGVMEKCTYCVQRIQEAKITAKSVGKPIRDGQIKTACQQVCPTGAITFGDLADPQSAVIRLHHSARAYAILAELNTQPRTVYLARIRNPNPELESTDRKHEHPSA